jgi:alkylmercury lyase
MSNTDSDTTTIEDTDRCCGSTEQETDTRSGGHWLDEVTLEKQLPDDLRAALGRFLGVESVDTLAEWGEQIRRRAGGGSIDVEQLCHIDGDSAHWGSVDGERYHFQCFYDAVIHAALENQPVNIHTVSPGGSVIEASVVGTEELSVTPETAVFSLGIAMDAHEHTSGTPTLQDSYAAICPYVKAFPDRDAYQQWADDIPAATVATPLSGATVFAKALTTEEDHD